LALIAPDDDPVHSNHESKSQISKDDRVSKQVGVRFGTLLWGQPEFAMGDIDHARWKESGAPADPDQEGRKAGTKRKHARKMFGTTHPSIRLPGNIEVCCDSGWQNGGGPDQAEYERCVENGKDPCRKSRSIHRAVPPPAVIRAILSRTLGSGLKHSLYELWHTRSDPRARAALREWQGIALGGGVIHRVW
jgi:hypothetical protein